MDYLKRYDNHPQLNSTMATKYPALLKLDVKHFNKPPRVRVSLMPQKYSDILEPKMQKIESRIQDINRLKRFRMGSAHKLFTCCISKKMDTTLR